MPHGIHNVILARECSHTVILSCLFSWAWNQVWHRRQMTHVLFGMSVNAYAICNGRRIRGVSVAWHSLDNLITAFSTRPYSLKFKYQNIPNKSESTFISSQSASQKIIVKFSEARVSTVLLVQNIDIQIIWMVKSFRTIIKQFIDSATLDCFVYLLHTSNQLQPLSSHKLPVFWTVP